LRQRLRDRHELKGGGSVSRPWEEIRNARIDLTDYVVHLTRGAEGKSALDVLIDILRCNRIKATFAPMRSRHRVKLQNTIKGPDPAVCFTEQPLWAIIKSRGVLPDRYSGYGIAYHKWCLHAYGGRPVIYGTYEQLGTRIEEGEPGWLPDRDIFRDGLPLDLQYLWAFYGPHEPDTEQAPVDFTWEREWRKKTAESGVPVVLPIDRWRVPKGAIIVERDFDVPRIGEAILKLHEERRDDYDWAPYIRIISLETAERKIGEGDNAYARLDDWPAPKANSASE
jgi:hypothetical protein